MNTALRLDCSYLSENFDSLLYVSLMSSFVYPEDKLSHSLSEEGTTSSISRI